MAYKIILTGKANRQLEEFGQEIQKRVGRMIDLLAENPRCPGSKRLKGRNYLYRIHAGKDHVILYQIEDQIVTVLVVRIANRKDAYRNLPDRVTKI